jgi:hypothetical protein
LSERRDARFHQGIVFVERHEHADAPHALGLLLLRRERPCRRAAEPGDEVAPSKANAHLALPCETPVDQPVARASTEQAAPGFRERTGSRDPAPFPLENECPGSKKPVLGGVATEENHSLHATCMNTGLPP